MGDDWPDLSAFAIAGMSVTVPNGHEEVRRRAHLVTQSMGGRGAVREVCDMLLIAKAFTKNLKISCSTALIIRLLKKVGYSCSWIPEFYQLLL